MLLSDEMLHLPFLVLQITDFWEISIMLIKMPNHPTQQKNQGTSFMKKAINSLLLAGVGLTLATSAHAGASLTPWQDVTLNLSNLNSTSTLLFNGFDVSLGTLESVHFQYTITETLNNVVTNLNATARNVGSPNPLFAVATTTFTGPLGLSATNTLQTPNFVGSVPARISPSIPSITTVGTASTSNLLVGPVVLTGNPTSLAAYIGGTNSVSITSTSSGTQSGSVPALVFTGNNGSATIVASLRYDYTPTVITTVPEPASLALLGTGLVGFRIARRHKK